MLVPTHLIQGLPLRLTGSTMTESEYDHSRIWLRGAVVEASDIRVEETPRGWFARVEVPRIAVRAETREAAIQELTDRVLLVEELAQRWSAAHVATSP